MLIQSVGNGFLSAEDENKEQYGEQGRKEQTKNSVGLFRKRTIPTKRPQLVNEVSANFC
jgi:hypothetical protein